MRQKSVHLSRLVLLFAFAKSIRQPAARYVDSTKRQRGTSDSASDSELVPQFLERISVSRASKKSGLTWLLLSAKSPYRPLHAAVIPAASVL